MRALVIALSVPRPCKPRQELPKFATSLVHASLNSADGTPLPNRNLIAGMAQAIEKFEHSSLLLRQQRQGGADPFTNLRLSSGLARVLDGIVQQLGPRPSPSHGSERRKAKAVGDAQDPSGNFRSPLESCSTLPDDPQRVVRDLFRQVIAARNSPCKGCDAPVVPRVNLPQCCPITGCNRRKQRAIAIVGDVRSPHVVRPRAWIGIERC